MLFALLSRRLHSGASLIEVLVSLLLLSLSVAASFGLELRASYLLEQALSRASAFYILTSARQSVLANPRAASTFADDAVWRNLKTQSGTSPTQCNLSQAVQCTATQRAFADIALIQTNVQKRFPGSRVGVNACGGMHCLILSWQAGGTELCLQQSYDQRDCVFLAVRI